MEAKRDDYAYIERPILDPHKVTEAVSTLGTRALIKRWDENIKSSSFLFNMTTVARADLDT